MGADTPPLHCAGITWDQATMHNNSLLLFSTEYHLVENETAHPKDKKSKAIPLTGRGGL
jgi:hypothetical protein